MTLLGQFCLWIAILVGAWGAVVGFSGRWQGRPALAEAVIRSVYAVLGLMVVATICLWQGLISHDFNIEYVAGIHLPQPADLFHRLGLLGGSEGFAAVLGGSSLALLQPGAAGSPRRATAR